MARPHNEGKEHFHEPFPTALRNLIAANGVTQTEILDLFGVKRRQSITGYIDGSTAPTPEKIAAVARHFGVSADYLIGLSPYPTNNKGEEGNERRMQLDEFAVLGDAIQHYGPDAQQIKAVEEMSELTKEICKRLAGADNVLQIAEEIADVEITLDQVKMMFCCAGRVKAIRASKIRRLAERIQDEIVARAAEKAGDPEVAI